MLRTSSRPPDRRSRTYIRIEAEKVREIPQPDGLLLLRFRRFFLGLLLARAPHHIAESVIAFLAGILQEWLVGRRPGHFAGPGTVPGLRIFHREAIQQCFIVNARKALHYVEVLGRSAK